MVLALVVSVATRQLRSCTAASVLLCFVCVGCVSEGVRPCRYLLPQHAVLVVGKAAYTGTPAPVYHGIAPLLSKLRLKHFVVILLHIIIIN